MEEKDSGVGGDEMSCQRHGREMEGEERGWGGEARMTLEGRGEDMGWDWEETTKEMGSSIRRSAGRQAGRLLNESDGAIKDVLFSFARLRKAATAPEMHLQKHEVLQQNKAMRWLHFRLTHQARTDFSLAKEAPIFVQIVGLLFIPVREYSHEVLRVLVAPRITNRLRSL